MLLFSDSIQKLKWLKLKITNVVVESCQYVRYLIFFFFEFKMGYPETLAARALRHTNNEMNLAIDAMNETPELLITNYEDFDEQKITKEMIENVSSMGFDRDVANEALKHCKGDLQKTLDLLTNNPEKISDIMEKSGEEFQKTEDARKRMEEDIGEGNGFLICIY